MKPQYIRIKEKLELDIQSGHFQVGDRLLIEVSFYFMCILADNVLKYSQLNRIILLGQGVIPDRR
ncbi:hypothetical protein JOE23_003223 [Amphibacillus cookii]|nr:hypothetical protein [Amphibacillus cookii]